MKQKYNLEADCKILFATTFPNLFAKIYPQLSIAFYDLWREYALQLGGKLNAIIQIVSSRAFSERITEFCQMQQAVSEYVHRASEKLRSQSSKAKQLTVFIRTSPFSNHGQDPFYSNSATGVLISPTDDTRDFLHLAGELLKKIWKAAS